MLDSVLLYLGLALVFVGLLSLVRPLRFLRIRTRMAAATVASIGLLLVVVILALPARNRQVTSAQTRLDDWMPAWQFAESHVVHVRAAPNEVFNAIRAVRADEILLFRTLIAIRRCGQSGPEDILNAPEQQPLLDVATATTFVVLADEPPREFVVGTVVAQPADFSVAGELRPEMFRKALPPGVALAAMNFLVLPNERGGSIVSSETRVNANSAGARRRFAIYWRIIHPGSDIIRRMWLRAIKRRAEVLSK